MKVPIHPFHPLHRLRNMAVFCGFPRSIRWMGGIIQVEAVEGCPRRIAAATIGVDDIESSWHQPGDGDQHVNRLSRGQRFQVRDV